MNLKLVTCLSVFLFSFSICAQIQVSNVATTEALPQNIYPKKATITSPFSYVYAQARGNSLIVGRLTLGTKIAVLAETTDAQFVQTEILKNAGNKEYILKGFVRKIDLNIIEELKSEPVSSVVSQVPPIEEEKAHALFPYIKRPWGLGVGFGGYSSRSESVFGLLAEIRYRWSHVTESIFGVDFTFGSEVEIVSRVAQRFYLTLDETIQPFLHLGYRSLGALDFGLGVAVNYTEKSYFEISANQLISTKPGGGFVWIFGGSSGFRF